MNPVQYIIANHTLKMSPGKLAAQVAHASVEGLRLNAKEPWGNPWDESIVNRWYQGGHYTKIVLEADDLAVAGHYLMDRGFQVALIIDEGRTEFDGRLTPTAIGCPVLDRDVPHVRETFSTFKVYGTTDRKESEARAETSLYYGRVLNEIIDGRSIPRDPTNVEGGRYAKRRISWPWRTP